MSTAAKKIMLAHGGGGRLTDELIRGLIVPAFKNEALNNLGDSATLDLPSASICLTTDSYVIKPLFFNGGDIGKLAVCGTINDLAVSGARPLALTLGLIIEEGLDFEILEKIIQSAAETARGANISIVAGDTKVVEKGAADQIFINTSGIGIRLPNVELGFDKIKSGDCVIVSGTIGDHGMTIMSQREGIKFESKLASDCAPLSDLTCRICENVSGIKFMRDPTRGGLAAVLNEIAMAANVSIEISEADIPISPNVQAAADMLGFDVLNIANEGKFIAVVARESADEVPEICKKHPLGKKASLIGRVIETQDVPTVEILTRIGGKRIVQMPYGRELPRIC
jgi:hydrogenase expression/formation protein HypE